jgi:hypothetical protein
MMNKLATLCCALLAAVGLHAQNTALQFDGQDDFAFVTINQPPTTINAESYTFEAIFKAVATGQNMVLLSVPQAAGNLLFGLDDQGTPYLAYRDNMYRLEEPQNLNDEQCHHMAITVFDMMVKFYVDGQYIGYTPLNIVPPFTNQTNFYLGMDYPDPSTAFMGVLDEVRLWPEARTDAEIMKNAFFTPYLDYPTYLIIPFMEETGTVAFDPRYQPHNFAYWLNSEGADMQWVEPCVFENYDFAERIGTNPLPPCVTPINPNEHICNGNFEQFDSILKSPPVGAVVNQPLHVSAGYSDVVNWSSIAPFTNMTPDFWVRLGIGGIPTPFNYTFNSQQTYTWNWPNNANSAMAGLYSAFWAWPNPNNFVLWEEGIKSELLYPLNANSTYTFRAKCSTSGTHLSPFVGIDTTQNLEVRFKSSNNASLDYLAGVVTLKNRLDLPISNGWENVSITFTTPPNLTPNSYDMIEIHTRSLGDSSSFQAVYTFIDDVSLLPDDTCATNFPIAIPLDTSHNQHMDRFMGIDSSGNVYMAGNSRTSFGISGYFINKYGPCGDTIWSKPVVYNDSSLTAMKVTPSGRIFLGEYSEATNTAKIRVLDANGSFLHLSILIFAESINDITYSPSSQRVVFTYGQNIVRDVSLSFSYGIPYGKTEFTEIDVIECDANGNLYMAGWKDGATRKLVVSKGGGTSPYNIVNSANIYTYQNGSALPSFHERMVQDIGIDGLGNVWLAGAYASEMIAGTDTFKAFSNNFPNNGYLLKYNPSLGNVLVAKALNDTVTHRLNTSYLSSIEVDANNNILAAGCFDTMYVDGTMYHSGSAPGLETFVLSLDATGNYRWLEHTKNSGANGWPYTNENQVVIETQELTGNYMVAGNFYQSTSEVFEHGTLNSTSLNNAFLCRLKDEGNDAFFKTGNQPDITTKEKAALPKLYPNPASDQLTIANPTDQLSSVTLYNAQGQQVLQGELSPGANTFGVAHLPAGLYFAAIKMNQAIHTVKVVIE